MESIRFDNFPKKFLHKWIGENIHDDPKEPPVYAVSFFMERPSGEGMSSFYYVAYENPPLIDFSSELDSGAWIENPIMLKPSDEVHPYHYAAPNKVFRAMIKSVFGETEVKVIK